ncbi:MAG: methyl-accepting chemotaxis protein, partial [Hungatella sp.]
STELIEQIASASNEQADASAQITRGIDQIASVVQTNSATAEESAAASEELSGQAQVLKNLVEGFRLLA